MDARKWILNEDEVCKQDRISRLQWLIEQTTVTEKHWLFRGGLISKYLFEEVRYCFVYGQFLAVINLGLSFIEQTLASEFYGIGRNSLERASISVLLEKALSQGRITQDEYDHFNRAREIRNAVTHFRQPGDEERVESKAVVGAKNPYEIIEEEARFVVVSMFRVLERFSGD